MYYFLNIKRWFLFFYFSINYHISNKLIKLNPVIEYAQNDTHIFIHIINKKLLPIKNLNISLTSTSLKIKYEQINQKDRTKYLFNKDIILYSLCKNNTLYIKKENEYNYIIFFEKIIPTFYWNYLDQEIDDHKNIYIWLDLYNKYQEKSKFNEYKDFVESNQIIYNYNNILKEKEENKKKEKSDINYSSEKRNNKLNKIKKEIEIKNKKKIECSKYKSRNNCLPLIKKCYSTNKDDIYDINFWFY